MNHGDSIASSSPWTQRIPQSVLNLISLGAQESLLLKLAMLSLSLRNADNIKLSSETFLVFNNRVFLIGLQCWPGQWPNSISWPLSCPVVLAQCVLQHWFLCHDVIMCFFLLWLHDRNSFHDVTMCFCMYMPGDRCITILNLNLNLKS